MTKTTLSTSQGPVVLEVDGDPWITVDLQGARLHFDPLSLGLENNTVLLSVREGALVLTLPSPSEAEAVMGQIKTALPHLRIESESPPPEKPCRCEHECDCGFDAAERALAAFEEANAAAPKTPPRRVATRR